MPPGVGAYIHEQLKAVAEKSSLVRQVRGRGLMLAVELAIPARALVEQALAEGVLSDQAQKKLKAAVWGLEKIGSVSELMAMLETDGG